MKNIICSFILGVLTLSMINAQDPAKDVKKADRLLGLYLLDTKSNKEKLIEARKLIDAVAEDTLVSNLFKTHYTKGNIYNELASIDNIKLVLSANSKLENPDAALTAFESLTKAKSLAIKSYEIKDVLNSLRETSQYLNNFATGAYNNQEFYSAFKQFAAALKINTLLKESNEKPIFESQDDINKQKYTIAVCADYANQLNQVINYLEDLRNENFNNEQNAGPIVYGMLFKYYLDLEEKGDAELVSSIEVKSESKIDINGKTDKIATASNVELRINKSQLILSEGRKKYPDDSNLLFTEINSLLKKGKLNELIDKLKLAVVKEPNNMSIKTTLGNVYDNMCQKEWEKGDMVKAQEYFNESLKYYQEALDKEPSNVVALYSIGALYYNYAAIVSKEANKLSNDYSSAGTKKYKDKQAEMEVYFDKALPYFEQADKFDNKDVNTLIALKEIYAKKGKFDKSNEIKARLESLKK